MNKAFKKPLHGIPFKLSDCCIHFCRQNSYSVSSDIQIPDINKETNWDISKKGSLLVSNVGLENSFATNLKSQDLIWLDVGSA